MRRFVQSFYAHRRVQVTVLKDTAAREFVVYRWRAQTKELERVANFPYWATSSQTERPAAIAHAKALIAQEDARCLAEASTN